MKEIFRTLVLAAVVPVFVMPPLTAQEVQSKFTVSNGRKTITIVTPTRSAGYDDAKKKDLGNWDKVSDEIYLPAGFRPVKDGETVNQYRITKNTASHRQLCGGLAFSRLVGGPHLLPSGEIFKVVDSFGFKGKPVLPGDVVVFFKDGPVSAKTVGHYAIIDGQVSTTKTGGLVLPIVTKNGPQRAYRGSLGSFPEFTDYQRVIYRIPWEDLDVRREGDPGIKVPTPPANVPKNWLIANSLRDRDRKAFYEVASALVSPIGEPKFDCSVSNNSRTGSVTITAFSQKDENKITFIRNWGVVFLLYPGVEEAKKALEDRLSPRDLVQVGKEYYRTNPKRFDTPKIPANNGTMVTADEIAIQYGRWVLVVESSTSRVGFEGRTPELWKVMLAADRKNVDQAFALANARAMANEIGKPERPNPFQLD